MTRCAISRRSPRWSPIRRSWRSVPNSHQDCQGIGRARQGNARRRHLRFDRHRLDAASRGGDACHGRRRQIPARALSRRGASLDRPPCRPVQVLAADVPVLIAQIQAGSLVPIGAAADKRNAILPQVPTLAEQGYADTDASNWYGLLAPAKTPLAVIAKLNGAVNARSTTRRPGQARQFRGDAGRRHAGSVRHVSQGRERKMGPRGARARHQG